MRHAELAHELTLLRVDDLNQQSALASAKWAMCRWTLGPIERRVTVLVKPLTRKFFLDPDSGYSNILLFLLSCTNKLYVGDMQDR